MEQKIEMEVVDGKRKGSWRSLFVVITAVITLFGARGAEATVTAYIEDTTPRYIEEVRDSYGEMINIAALLHDYDPNMILAVIVIESEGNETARSHAGARGLMQLMPQTARAMGVKNPNDPFQNILAGTRYLKELEGAYGFSSTADALVAYNMGPSRAKRWLSQYDSREYGYVKKVMYVHSLLLAEKKSRKDGGIAESVRAPIGGTHADILNPISLKPHLYSFAEKLPSLILPDRVRLEGE